MDGHVIIGSGVSTTAVEEKGSEKKIRRMKSIDDVKIRNYKGAKKKA